MFGPAVNPQAADIFKSGSQGVTQTINTQSALVGQAITAALDRIAKSKAMQAELNSRSAIANQESTGRVIESVNRTMLAGREMSQRAQLAKDEMASREKIAGQGEETQRMGQTLHAADLMMRQGYDIDPTVLSRTFKLPDTLIASATGTSTDQNILGKIKDLPYDEQLVQLSGMKGERGKRLTALAKEMQDTRERAASTKLQERSVVTGEKAETRQQQLQPMQIDLEKARLNLATGEQEIAKERAKLDQKRYGLSEREFAQQTEMEEKRLAITKENQLFEKTKFTSQEEKETRRLALAQSESELRKQEFSLSQQRELRTASSETRRLVLAEGEGKRQEQEFEFKKQLVPLELDIKRKELTLQDIRGKGDELRVKAMEDELKSKRLLKENASKIANGTLSSQDALSLGINPADMKEYNEAITSPIQRQIETHLVNRAFDTSLNEKVGMATRLQAIKSIPDKQKTPEIRNEQLSLEHNLRNQISGNVTSVLQGFKSSKQNDFDRSVDEAAKNLIAGKEAGIQNFNSSIVNPTIEGALKSPLLTKLDTNDNEQANIFVNNLQRIQQLSTSLGYKMPIPIFSRRTGIFSTNVARFRYGDIEEATKINNAIRNMGKSSFDPDKFKSSDIKNLFGD